MQFCGMTWLSKGGCSANSTCNSYCIGPGDACMLQPLWLRCWRRHSNAAVGMYVSAMGAAICKALAKSGSEGVFNVRMCRTSLCCPSMQKHHYLCRGNAICVHLQDPTKSRICLWILLHSEHRLQSIAQSAYAFQISTFNCHTSTSKQHAKACSMYVACIKPSHHNKKNTAAFVKIVGLKHLSDVLYQSSTMPSSRFLWIMTGALPALICAQGIRACLLVGTPPLMNI